MIPFVERVRFIVLSGAVLLCKAAEWLWLEPMHQENSARGMRDNRATGKTVNYCLELSVLSGCL